MTRCKIWIAFLFAGHIAFGHGLTCHCLNQNECSQVGSCSQCEENRAGPTCNIKIGKLDVFPAYATQSSTKEDHVAGLAVDGNDTSYAWVQNTSSVPSSVSWTLDLQSTKSIYGIQIMFLQSTDESVIKRRPGFSVAISDRGNLDYSTAQMCHQDNSTSGGNIGSVTVVDCDGMAQYVHIFNSRNEALGNIATWSKYANLELAEVAVIEDQVCVDGYYDTKCDKPCGNCLGGTCERHDGTCSACTDGWFGTKCDQQCGHCEGGKCNQGDGTCPGLCADGWYGTICAIPCSQFCVGGCRQADGTCNQCPPRRSGPQCELCTQCKDNECNFDGTCKIACADPTVHGDDCNIACSGTITGCIECQSVTGFTSCTKCLVGKYLDKCLDCPSNCVECVSENNCTACKPGFSGLDCSNLCSKPNCVECHPNGKCKSCYRGFFVSGGSCASCSAFSNFCLACTGPFDCEECMPGYYLANGGCKKCPGNCLECSSEQLCTTCEAGWQGVTCKCGQNCKQDGTMPVSDWCSQGNGTCLKGCAPGKYTSDCQKDCPPLDSTCLVCDQNDGNCFECIPGRYGKYGLQFNSSCSETCGHCADSKCRVDDGACDGPCLSGYHGAGCTQTCSATCRNGSCEINSGKCQMGCQMGFYGDQCDKECNANCKLEQTSCTQDYGFCDSCNVGFYGNQCDKKCNINCKLGNTSCRQYDGYCESCNTGFFGHNCSSECKNCMGSCQKADGRCDECAIGYHVNNCTYKCPDNCLNKCYRETGHCLVCLKMFYGSSCENHCPDNCGEMGVQQNLCNKNTGYCQQCKPGYYGNTCEYKCSDQCGLHFTGQVTCEQSDGQCFNCPVGSYGMFCGLPCIGKCVNPSNPHKVGECHQESSECIHGCQHGYHSNMCNMSCNKGCRDQQCDIDTALCLNGCEEGFKGEYCAEEMPGPNNGVIIGVVVGLVVLIAVAVVILLICRRRRAKPKKQQDETLLERIRKQDVTDRTTLINGSKKDAKDKPRLPKRTKSDNVENGEVDNEDEMAPLVVANTDPSEYYNLSSQISVDFFGDYLRNRRNKDEEWYKDEFKKLPSGLLREAKTSSLPGNQGKCRYKQLYPYDWNRVKLDPDGDVTGDFINASYLKGYNQPEAFIAAQGPTVNTVNDFWRMIWQKECGKIVMLTNLVEEMKTKCVQYWPELDSSETFGKYEVELTSERVLPNFTIRCLKVTHTVTKEVKDFTLYHYTTWPDRNVPDNLGVILAFREKVMEDKALLNGPILVHCSAGIGRTGTFIALDYLIRQAHAEKTIDVFRTVTDMRYQRSNFVQTDIQYEFLHNAIQEALTVNESEITAADFNQYYLSLLDNNKEQLKIQYQAIHELSQVLDENCFAVGKSEENIHKNRYPAILPPDLSRAYLSTPVKGGNDYINAVFLPTCMNKTGLLITQMPLPHTVTDFWRLVYDQHVHNIVMMNNVDDDDDTIGEYWPSDDSTYGPFRVQMLSCENPCEDFSIMNMLLTYKSLSRESKMQVKMFRLQSWSEDEMLPASTKPLTSLYSQVSLAPRDSPTEAVIVHCMNGAERSGLYCVIAAVLERLNAEQKVNIPQTVQQLRGRRPQLIHTLDQLEFVYKAVADYIESMQEYANLQF